MNPDYTDYLGDTQTLMNPDYTDYVTDNHITNES